MASRIWGDGLQPTSDGLQPTLCPFYSGPFFHLGCRMAYGIQFCMHYLKCVMGSSLLMNVLAILATLQS